MALPVSEGIRPIDSDHAQRIANGYLVDYVGDLLEAGTPELAQHGRWSMPILLSNVRRGNLGEVGVICVDRETGQVIFSEEDRAKVKARARLLARSSSL
jgi:hypothetical protein